MSELHDGLVIQTCVQNPNLIICFCFRQIYGWIFAKEINTSDL